MKYDNGIDFDAAQLLAFRQRMVAGSVDGYEVEELTVETVLQEHPEWAHFFNEEK